MTIDCEIKELRNKLTKAWETKLKNEGYKGIMGVGGKSYAESLRKQLEAELNEENKPGEVRIIHSGVLGHLKCIPSNSYQLFVKKSWDIIRPNREDYDLWHRGVISEELGDIVKEELTNHPRPEMRIIRYGIMNKKFLKKDMYSVYVTKF